MGGRRPALLPAVQLAGRRPRRGLRRPCRPALPGGGHHRPRPGHRLLRRAHRDRRRRRPRLVPRGAGRRRAQRGHRLRPAGRARRSGVIANQPSYRAGTLDIEASHQGGPLRPVLRRLRHPAGHLRRQLRASSRARTSSGRASSATAPSWWRPTPPPPSPGSASCCARPTAAPTSSWTPGAWAATCVLAWPDGRDRGDGRAGRGRRSSTAAGSTPSTTPPTGPAPAAELEAEYAVRFCTPQVAAERGFVDDVIDPTDTRRLLVAGLAALRSKRVPPPDGLKHTNPPL